MKLSKAKIAILSTLALSQYDMSSREIHETITANGKISTTISSVYDYVDSLKKDGLIENGISDVVNGRTVLMWRITNKGRALVGDSKDEIVEAEVIDEPEAIDEPAALLRSIDNLEEKIGTLHKLLPIVTDEMAAVLNSIVEDLSNACTII